jgi:hypothetical protein
LKLGVSTKRSARPLIRNSVSFRKNVLHTTREGSTPASTAINAKLGGGVGSNIISHSRARGACVKAWIHVASVDGSPLKTVFQQHSSTSSSSNPSTLLNSRKQYSSNTAARHHLQTIHTPKFSNVKGLALNNVAFFSNVCSMMFPPSNVKGLPCQISKVSSLATLHRRCA